jgi:hypothetical protein
MPGWGHLDWGGTLETLKCLQKEGHDVKIASGSNLKKVSSTHQIPFLEISLPPFELKTPHKTIDSILSNHFSNNFFDVSSHYLAYQQILGEDADLIISDAYCRSAPLVAKQLHIPHVVIAPESKTPSDKIYLEMNSLALEFNEQISYLVGHSVNYDPRYPLIFHSDILNLHFSTHEFTGLNETSTVKLVGGDPINKNPISKRIYFTSGTLFWDYNLNQIIQTISQNYFPIHTNHLNQDIGSLTGLISHGIVDEASEMGENYLLISQGGYGTISKGIRAGIPIIITPLFIGNSLQAKRIKSYGNGIVLDLEKQNVLELQRAITEINSNPDYTIKAEKLKKEYSFLGGSRRASELILNLL